jgi:hypothetical protein
MFSSRIFVPVVLGAMLAFSALAIGVDYWSYVGEYVHTSKDTNYWEGFFCSQDPTYDNQNAVFTSPADDTQTVFTNIANALDVPLRPDAFSFDNDISSWLASEEKALYFTTVQNFDENGLNLGGLNGKYGYNDDVNIITEDGYEAFVKHAQLYNPPTGNSLGNTDIVGGQGRLQRGNEFVLSDYDFTVGAPDPTGLVYFSAGRYALAGSGAFDLNQQVFRPNATWAPGCSDYLGRAHAGDVLTQYVDTDSITHRGVFEAAYKIAGTMVGDQFWTGGLVWNTYGGFVSTSTASNATEAAGHEVVREFLRYVFDIDALKVQDVNGNGVFDQDGGDAILFSVVDPKYFKYYYSWDNQYRQTASPFAGQYFTGDTIFLYQAGSVTTIMDRGTSIFFGTTISTSNATIWGEKFGLYDITAFDIVTTTIVPEPVTIIMIGAGLVSVAGVVRRRLRK